MGLLHPRQGSFEGITTANSRDTFGARLLHLGPLSLLALIVGGLLLILTALDVLLGPNLKDFESSVVWASEFVEGRHEQIRGVHPFHVGQFWSVQTWLAIVGVSFGLLSHGLHEANVHLFDWWCSRQARSTGLDYARYLNTQPRAPVSYGLRGFPVLASLRYLMLVVSIAASIGYKFGIMETTIVWRETLDPSTPYMLLENQTVPYYLEDQMFHKNSMMAHWFGTDLRAFTYEYQTVGNDSYNTNLTALDLQGDSDPDDLKAPQKIILVGQLKTSMYYLINTRDALGDVTARQVVAVANMAEDEGNFTMSRDKGNWHRVETLGDRWSGHIRQRVVVDYRILKPGKVQIQWAPLGSWLTDESSAEQTQQVTQRWTYSMNYATAEVHRKFTDDSGIGHFPPMTMHSGAKILRDGPALPSTNQTEERFLETRWTWIDAQVSAKYTRMSQGVMAIVRPIMYEWAMMDAYHATHVENSTFGSPFKTGWHLETDFGPVENEFIRLLPNSEFPFGDEDHSETARSTKHPELEYPYFAGNRFNGITGCYPAAARAFLAAGIVALLIAILRVWIGPAELTSWTGQHVYLSQAGMLLEQKNSDVLASGYHVAPRQLGRLHLGCKATEASRSSVDERVREGEESEFIRRETSLH